MTSSGLVRGSTTAVNGSPWSALIAASATPRLPEVDSISPTAGSTRGITSATSASAVRSFAEPQGLDADASALVVGVYGEVRHEGVGREVGQDPDQPDQLPAGPASDHHLLRVLDHPIHPVRLVQRTVDAGRPLERDDFGHLRPVLAVVDVHVPSSRPWRPGGASATHRAFEAVEDGVRVGEPHPSLVSLALTAR